MDKRIGRAILTFVMIAAAIATPVITIRPAVAGLEDPPQPGILTYIFSGTEHYREGVVVWELRVEIPDEYRPTMKKMIYYKGMEIPQGARLRLYALVHYGQQKIDGATDTQIHVSQPGQVEGFISLHRSRMGMVKKELVADKWADEPMVFRIYLSPDGRNLNAYDFIWLRVTSREEIFKRMGYTSPAKPEDARVPETYPRGRVTVYAADNRKIASATLVVKTAEGKEIEYATRQDIPGTYTFDNVPVGEVRIKAANYTGEKPWRLLGPPSLLRQQLIQGATVSFTLTQNY